MLDDGHLTDGLGRKINFKNCLIIMTSNIGVKKLQDFGAGVGFKTNSDIVKEEHKRDILKRLACVLSEGTLTNREGGKK